VGDGGRGRERAQDQQRQRALQQFTLGRAGVDDRKNMCPRSLHGSIPVSVRTILIRKVLAGWEGKVVSLNFTSWNLMIVWLRQVDSLQRAA